MAERIEVLLPTCEYCGDLCGEPPKVSPFSGANVCAACAAEEDPTIDRDDHDYPWRDVL